MRGPIGVRVNDGKTSKHVTGHVTGLSFRKEAPGGHHSASFTLTTPIADFTDLGQNDAVTIYDSTTGKVLWDGDASSVEKQIGPRGEQYAISATGGSGRFTDRTEKLMYLDAGRDQWAAEDAMPQVADATVALDDVYPDGDRAAGGTYANADDTARSCIRLQFPSSTPVVADSEVGARYKGFVDSLMVPGAFLGWVGKGADAASEKIYGDVTIVATVPTPYDLNVITSGGGQFWFVAYADPTYAGSPGSDQWPYDTQSVGVAMRWTGGATTISTDAVWVGFDPPVVMAQMLDQFGDRIDMKTFGRYPAVGEAYLLASDLVADLVGRLLEFIDPDRCEIAATTYEIDQATFPDGISAADLLGWLTVMEPDHFHEVLERNDDGLFAMNFRQWDDTNPRYLIFKSDDYEAPGGESQLCNRMFVYYTDAAGVRRRETVTQAVPALDTPAFGPARIRQADPFTLPDGLGSQANAQQIGAALLAQSNRGTGAGRAVVSRRVRDLWRGDWVHPCEIVPGYSALVAETREQHRVTAVDYDADNEAMTLTLGEPERSPDQLIADLTRRGRTTAKASR